jgi:hypothetical protein
MTPHTRRPVATAPGERGGGVTLVAEIEELDDSFEVRPVARLLVSPGGGIEVVELRPRGAALARVLLAETLVDPYGRTVTSADGADFVRTLRWARSTDSMWVTPLAELPDHEARDPGIAVPVAGVPYVPATMPYPAPPAELSGVRVVELRRPTAADYCRTEVVARLVGLPGAPVRVEGPDELAVRQLATLLDALGHPPLDELADTQLAPGLVTVTVDFGRPGDMAWRDGVVGTRRAAVAAGDLATVARLDLEFATRLPRVWLSRCPFTGEVLRLAFDGWGFDSPFWDPAAPVRGSGDHLPATFLGLAGSVADRAAARRAAVPAEAVGAGRPPVFPVVAGDAEVRAVLSAVQVGTYRCDVVAYFSRSRPAGPPAFREWGTRLARVPDGAGWRWVSGPDADPPVLTDLEPLIRSGQLAWIRPFDPGVTLRTAPAGCPWLAPGEGS